MPNSYLFCTAFTLYNTPINAVVLIVYKLRAYVYKYKTLPILKVPVRVYTLQDPTLRCPESVLPCRVLSYM